MSLCPQYRNPERLCVSNYEYFKAEMLKAFGSSFLNNKCKSSLSASGQEAGVGIHDPLAGSE